MMNLEYDLSIIIPAYNAKNTIETTLNSIKNQKLSILFEVVIVNDCSNYNYKEYIDKYNKYFNIREINTKVNSGPGVSRQLGIDNTRSKYILFIDSDDCFYNEKSISKMYNNIKKENYDLLIGNFIMKTGLIDKKMYKDLIWLHGKMYKRSFLEKYNIKFNDTRANEDNGFNRLILFMNPKIIYLNEFVYIYNNNINSITRKDNNLYDFIGIQGFCYNMTWAINEAIFRGKKKDDFGIFSLDIMLTLYVYYFKFKNKYDVRKIFAWGSEIKKIYDSTKENITKKVYEEMLNKKRMQFIWSFPNDSEISFEKFLSMF